MGVRRHINGGFDRPVVSRPVFKRRGINKPHRLPLPFRHQERIAGEGAADAGGKLFGIRHFVFKGDRRIPCVGCVKGRKGFPVFGAGNADQ